MIDSGSSLVYSVLFLGALIVLSIFIRSGLKKTGIPSLIGFITLGFLIRLIDSQHRLISGESGKIFEFLAEIGVITLLFKVGLESNLKGLVKQLRHASMVWFGNIIWSGFVGFVISEYVFHLGLIPSLFIAVALTATSVGVSVNVWQEEEAVKSTTGELLLDVAEMDDISGIMFLALILSIIPVLKGNLDVSLTDAVGKTIGILLLKLFAFGLACTLFSRYVEPHITSFFSKIKHSPDPMLMVAGFGFIIAALAGLLGFSLALGAFFAGLVFSRDPKAVKLDASFGALYDLFTPFFFIGIGIKIEPSSLSSAVGLGAVLMLAAIIGKLIGNGLPSLFIMG
jgi:Kef-type K+ transport system membrane component KefB